MDKAIIEAAGAALVAAGYQKNADCNASTWVKGKDIIEDDVVVVVSPTTCAAYQKVPLSDLPALLNYQKTAEALRALVEELDSFNDLGEYGHFKSELSSLDDARTVLVAITPEEEKPNV